MNDLISREALKKALEISEKVFNQGLTTALDLIQSASTVDTTCPNCDSGYAQGYSDGYLTGKEERPKGKWEWVQYDANPNIGNWHCSECRYIPHGKKEYQKSNFCPNCGADMREGEEE